MIVDDVSLVRLRDSGFFIGAAASNFLSRGVKFASDAGSTVDCMQPPSTTATPNRTTDNPRPAMFCHFPGRHIAAAHVAFRWQLTEKPRHCHGFQRVHSHLPVYLLQECRSALNSSRQIDIGPKTLRPEFTIAGLILGKQGASCRKCHKSTRFAAHFRPSEVTTLGVWERRQGRTWS